jgi:hypothetical protein
MPPTYPAHSDFGLFGHDREDQREQFSELESTRGGCQGRSSTTASGHRRPSGAARGAGRPGATSKAAGSERT